MVRVIERKNFLAQCNISAKEVALRYTSYALEYKSNVFYSKSKASIQSHNFKANKMQKKK